MTFSPRQLHVPIPSIPVEQTEHVTPHPVCVCKTSENKPYKPIPPPCFFSLLRFNRRPGSGRQMPNALVQVAPGRGEFAIEERAVQGGVLVHLSPVVHGNVIVRSGQHALFVSGQLVAGGVVAAHPMNEPREATVAVVSQQGRGESTTRKKEPSNEPNTGHPYVECQQPKKSRPRAATSWSIPSSKRRKTWLQRSERARARWRTNHS